MKKSADTGMSRQTRSSIPTHTRLPFDYDDAAAQRIAELGISPHLAELQQQGYTVVPDIADVEFSARLRETCLRLAQETEGPAKGYSAALLLGRDAIFEEVVLNPRLLTMVEVMCGKGALLSQLICSVRPQGAPALGLHADQNWLPAPFPLHNQLFTMCWTMDDYSEEAGCTKVIPGSHVHKRHPNETEIRDEPGAIPAVADANSLVCWDGSIWHGNYPRTLAGERVVLHITFSRLALRPVENYDHLDESWLEGRPNELAVMLGREDFLGSTTIARGSADYSKIPRTFTWAKT